MDPRSPSQQQLILLGAAVLGVACLFNSSTIRQTLFSNTKTTGTTARQNDDDGHIDPTDYARRTRRILAKTPLIDGHNDFPFLLRQQLHSKIYDHDFLTQELSCHSDFQKMRKGMMGGQFWSVFVPIPEDLVPGVDVEDDTRPRMGFNEPNWAVRDTLEQIDVTKRMVAHYPSMFELCTDPASVRRVHASGKIASMIGVEGGHQTGGSLGALRMLFDSGARYMTLTHNSDNAFATCWKSVDLATGKDDGLSKFGEDCVLEMNRLGMMVDLSHVSPKTMRDTLRVAKAPVIFSHSGAYSVNKHLRNVPDDVIRGMKQNGGILMIPAIAPFMNTEHPEDATVEDVIDHILWVVELAGWDHVGLGSDFDGYSGVVKGLEDTSRWPNLIEELLARGNVTDRQAQMLVGDNLLRVWEEVDEVAKKLQEEVLPSEEYWAGRQWEPTYTDLPQVLPRDKTGSS